jgi:hypothetical protein
MPDEQVHCELDLMSHYIQYYNSIAGKKLLFKDLDQLLERAKDEQLSPDVRATILHKCALAKFSTE